MLPVEVTRVDTKLNELRGAVNGGLEVGRAAIYIHYDMTVEKVVWYKYNTYTFGIVGREYLVKVM